MPDKDSGREDVPGPYCYRITTIEKNMPPGTMKVAALAAKLGRDPNTMYRWIKVGKLKTIQPWPKAELHVTPDGAEQFEAFIATLHAPRKKYPKKSAAVREWQAEKYGEQLSRLAGERAILASLFPTLIFLEDKLWDIDQISEWLGYSTGRVQRYMESGELAYVEKVFQGNRYYFAEPREVKRFRRKLTLRASPQLRLWQDPETEIKATKTRRKRAGKEFLYEEVEAIRERVERRGRGFADAAKGPRPDPEKQAYEAAWQEDVDATWNEFMREVELGIRDQPPSDYAVGQDVVRRDMRANPTARRWNGYDPDSPASVKEATIRLLRAVKIPANRVDKKHAA